MTTTNTTTTPTTLAARAASLLSKGTTLAVVEKAMAQAFAAKRIHPAMAEDFSAQLGHELPLKTRDFVRVVGHLLTASEKPLKGIVSKKKHEILLVLSDLVGSLTDTTPMALPTWAIPKERAKKAEAADAEAASGSLEKANILAEAEANAAKAEAAQDLKLAQAVALVISRAAELSADQRAMLAAVLGSTSTKAEAEAEESTEA